MGWTVYSERFVLVQGVVGSFDYHVPAGHRAVIKCVTCCNYGAVPHFLSVSITGATLLFEDVMARTQRVYTNLSIPAYAGEFIRTQTDNSDLATSISGYLFADAGHRAAAEVVPSPEPWELEPVVPGSYG